VTIISEKKSSGKNVIGDTIWKTART